MEFTVLQQDAGKRLVYVAFIQSRWDFDRSDAACDALERVRRRLADLLRGAESFRDQRYDEARQLLARAAQDPQQKALAATLAARGECRRDHCGAGPRGQRRAAFTSALPRSARHRGAALEARQICLALPLDEGRDRLASGLEGAPASKLDRDDLISEWRFPIAPWRARGRRWRCIA